MDSPDLPCADRVKLLLRTVFNRIRKAALDAKRSPDEIKLVAVTKYATCDDGFVDSLIKAECFDFGENRIKRLLEKQEHFGGTFRSFPGQCDAPRWHFIGSLQENKIRKMIRFVSLIHSIDSIKLLDAVNRIAGEEKLDHPVDVLLEAKISSDATKHGFVTETLPTLLPQLQDRPNIRIRGLMGMGGLGLTPSETRQEFASLHAVFDQCRAQLPSNTDFTELSMGMSDDFEIAVAQGATIVRVGSLLYP
ncbi:MAG: YggS family pyridoxal phosphate-dependent enzyme [Thermoguttaceae bacterium]|nr:YggS family pyridoxal phosphate-dependent enzyme [Thermoguttaceae bacterium]